MALFLILAVIDNGESIFRHFKYKLVHENWTKFKIDLRHVYWEQDKSSNEKIGVKNLVELSLKYDQKYRKNFKG